MDALTASWFHVGFLSRGGGGGGEEEGGCIACVVAINVCVLDSECEFVFHVLGGGGGGELGLLGGSFPCTHTHPPLDETLCIVTNQEILPL